METEAEAVPVLVASRSCRNDRKLVEFIIQQRMVLLDTQWLLSTGWFKKDNDLALRMYERIPTTFNSHSVLKLNQVIAYSEPRSERLKHAYLQRAVHAYANREDFYCMYNLWHLEEVDEIGGLLNPLYQELYQELSRAACDRRSGIVNPSPQHDVHYQHCFANVLCKELPECGRFLTPQRRCNRGSTVMCERPYVRLLVADRYFRCHYCLAHVPLVLIPCPTCSSTLYCSNTCRNRAYDEYHALECAILACLRIQFTTLEHLAVRLTCRVINMFAGQLDQLEPYVRSLLASFTPSSHSTPYGRDAPESPCKQYARIYHLATNRRQITRAALTENGLRAVSLAKLLVEQNKLPAGLLPIIAELTVRHMHIAAANVLPLHRSDADPAVESQNKTSTRYALVLLTTGSRLNHACNSNLAYQLTQNGTVSFLAKHHLCPGMQLTINYR